MGSRRRDVKGLIKGVFASSFLIPMAFGVPTSIGVGRDFLAGRSYMFEIHHYKCGFLDGFMFVGSFARIS